MGTKTTIALCTLVVGLAAGPVWPVTFYVNTSSDLPDSNLSDDECHTPTGACSLRAAVQQANWTWGHDTIQFTQARTHTVGSPLEVRSIITIHGLGSDGTGTTVDGNDSVEVFLVRSPETEWNPSELYLEHLRVRDGRRNITVEPDAKLDLDHCEIVDGQASLGGGIYADTANVTIEFSTIHGNTATSGGGGGIYFTSTDDSYDLYLTQSIVASNISGGNGAGIHAVSVGSTVTLNNSRLENNQTVTGFGGGLFSQLTKVLMTFSTLSGNLALRGGGLYNMVHEVTVRESSIWGNFASQAGGGVYLTTLQGGMSEIMNTTISGNGTAGSGGGIYLDTSDENWNGIAISSCTITSNTADTNTDDVGDGGGIYRAGTNDVLIMHNSILAENNDLSSAGYVPDCCARINGGYNIVGVATSLCELVGVSAYTNQKGTVASPLDPMLGPRVDEPYSAYHAVLEGSPAVDTGDPDGCTQWWTGTPLGYDQLGETRPYGTACDPGAIESPWILTHTLDIAIGGPCGGSVSSSPAGISCPSTCSHDFAAGTAVVLTPTPDSAYYDYFDGWQGDADCSDGRVTLDDEVSCTATFAEHPTHLLELLMAGTGSGTVVLDLAAFDLPCADDCELDVVAGDVVTLAPSPAPGSSFVAFSGDQDCLDGVVTVDADTQCTATFTTAGDLIFADDFESGGTSAWSDIVP